MLEAAVVEIDKVVIMKIVTNEIKKQKQKLKSRFDVVYIADLKLGNHLHVTIAREEGIINWTSQKILALSSTVKSEQDLFDLPNPT